MQVVIDIPKKTYEQLKFLDEHGILGFDTIIDEAVANGTPLPEGHGRLIDADKIEFEYYYGEWFVTEAAIDHQPTVLEADTESEDK